MTHPMTKGYILTTLRADPQCLLNNLIEIRETVALDMREMQQSIDNLNALIQICIDHRAKQIRMDKDIKRLEADLASDKNGTVSIEWKDYALSETFKDE
jgi:hypothetical protein